MLHRAPAQQPVRHHGLPYRLVRTNGVVKVNEIGARQVFITMGCLKKATNYQSMVEWESTRSWECAKVLLRGCIYTAVRQVLNDHKNGVYKEVIPDVLVIVHHQEHVNSIVSSLKSDGLADSCTTQMTSFPWKVDSVVYADGADGGRTATVTIWGTKRKPTVRLIIATDDVASCIELSHLMVVILCPLRQRQSAYKLNGLRTPTTDWVDGPCIKQAISRLGRNRDAFDFPGVFFFAGSVDLLSRLIATDSRQAMFSDAVAMVDELAQFCSVTGASNERVCAPHQIILEDAVLMGVIDGSRTKIEECFHILTSSLFGLHPQTAMVVVLGARAGVSRQAIVTAAIEMIESRHCQYARRHDDEHTYDASLLDVYKELSLFGNSAFPYIDTEHEEGGPYESEAVMSADVWASYLVGFNFSATGPERSKTVLMGDQRVHPSNFWSGGWSGGSRRNDPAWASVSPKIRAMADRDWNSEKLYRQYVKDHGREALEHAVRMICRLLYAMGVINHPDPICGPDSNRYNRYCLNQADWQSSPVLNKKGRSLFSGILAMASSTFGEWCGQKVLQWAEEGSTTMLTPRFRVWNGGNTDVLVHGYTIWQPSGARVYASYLRSSNAMNHAEPAKLRFHSRIHPVSLGQIVALGNSQSTYTTGPRLNDGQMTLEVPLSGWSTSGQAAVIKTDAHVVAALAKHRDYIKTALKAALSVSEVSTAEMDKYASHIILLWDRFHNVGEAGASYNNQ